MLNESFHKNVLGKQVSYDIQPYERGTGTIVSCTPRRIKGVRQQCPTNGTILVDYDCFDLEIEVEDGSATGALLSGRPIADTVKETKGQTRSVTGVTYRQLASATRYGETIVIARCG